MADLDYIERHALPHVIMTGNPVDGCILLGPFENYDAGLEYANDYSNAFTADWWLVPIHKPT